MKPLSFLIITYNRPADMLELLQNISGLDQAEKLLEEIIVVNNCSTESYKEVEAFIDRSTLPFQYFIAPANLGVAKGRNFALNLGTAPLIIMLDDDAVLQNKDCLVRLEARFSREDMLRPTAIVSFRVLYYETLEMQQNALPHKRYLRYRDRSFFETYYYAGGAHAVRRNIIEELGAYPENFFYGMEEYDLSFRILDAGYSIV
ncbi:MAG: glycosyltransferase, partial [Pedobacter sp.]